MEELHSKMGEDLKKKDEEIKKWKQQAVNKVTFIYETWNA
jgi:hypothetical protein